MQDYYKMLVFGDRHAISNDKKLDALLLQIIKDSSKNLKYIIDLGDGLDADCLSDYPKQIDQLSGLQAELDSDYIFRKEIKKLSSKSEKILLTCNHFTARFNKLKSKEHWMSDLQALEQQNLFKLNETGWKLQDEFIWGRNKILFSHGDGDGIGSQKNIINKARDLVKENHITVVRGHSHTTGMEVSRKFGEYFYAIQIGTLYNLKVAPRYIKSGQYLSNWTNSAGMFYCRSDGKKFFYTPIIFEDGETFFEGKHYHV